jgi:hypothetical protein
MIRERADDAAQVPGHRLLDRGLHLPGIDAEEGLRGLLDEVGGGVDLHLRHGLHVDRDALLRVHVGHVDLERHHLEREALGTRGAC